ncbi:hypothetical protein [Rubritalea tangerina]|uniref:hypothetical protein n=1 Tax=Rubritalea tangerina TaxID=430798 RepID=UPI00361B6739
MRKIIIAVLIVRAVSVSVVLLVSCVSCWCVWVYMRRNLSLCGVGVVHSCLSVIVLVLKLSL